MSEIIFVRKWTQSFDLFPFPLSFIESPTEVALILFQKFSGLSQTTHKTQSYLYEFLCHFNKANFGKKKAMGQSPS